jgi:hypothetical protein
VIDVETIKVPTDDGMIDVPCYRIEGCDGLVVIMHPFGEFGVAHEPSGLNLSVRYQRAANAFVDMLQLRIAIKEAGIDPTLSKNEFKKALRESEHKHESLCGMTILQSLSFIRGMDKITDIEFPWESFEDSPFGKIEDLKKILYGDKDGKA